MWYNQIYKGDNTWNIDVKNSVACYGITLFYVAGNVTAANLATQNSVILINGDVTIHENLIFSDTSIFFKVKGAMKVKHIINQISDSEIDQQFEQPANLDYKKAYIAKNSYGEWGNAELFSKLGIINVEELTQDDLAPIWSQLY